MTRDEFIAANIPLVHSLANRFRGRGIDYEELFSAGSLGLVKAYDNFDESRGLCFSTYAVPVILGAVKMSRSLKELSMKVQRAREELAKSGAEPTISELAGYLGITCEEAAEAVQASVPPMSLTDREEGGEFDVPVESMENSLIDRLALRQCMEKLSDDDRTLIVLRYFRSKTQSETAQLMGMSQVQVSRRERKILNDLRLQMT